MHTELVPKYYGTVETNLGTSYLHEHIIDFDGKQSLSLRDYVFDTELLQRNINILTDFLMYLRKQIVEDELITMGIIDENILLKKESHTDMRIYLVSDLGTSDFIPITRLHYFSQEKIRRKWQRLVEELQKEITYENEKYLTQLIHAISYK